MFSSGPPALTLPAVSTSYDEGTKVDVTCNATGKPTPTVTWIREGSSKVYSIGEGSATLSFSSISRSDAGQYRCKANNTAGTDKTGALSLVVHCKYKNKQEVIFTCLNGYFAIWGIYKALQHTTLKPQYLLNNAEQPNYHFNFPQAAPI